MRTVPRLAPIREMLNSLADDFAGSTLPGSLPLDIVEKPDCYEVHASVPGLTRDQITIEVEKGVLTINALVSMTNDIPTDEPVSGCGCTDKVDDCCMLRRERFSGSARRSLRLPTDIDDESITATLDKGVLTIVVGKPTPETPKSVSID
jgi:HSP20 family protein